MVFRALQIALIFCLLTPSTQAAPPKVGWLHVGGVACSLMLLTLGLREAWIGRQYFLEGFRSREAARLHPEQAGNHLLEAQRFYEAAGQHSANSGVASGVAAALASGLTYWASRGLVEIRDGYSSVRLTHIPNGLTLFHNDVERKVENGIVDLVTWGDGPQVVVLKRGEERVPIGPSGALVFAFPVGQHLKVRVDRLIEQYRSVDAKDSQL